MIAEEPFTNLKPETQEIMPSSVSLAVALDNLRSAYNVGSIFRTADAAGVQHLYLYGITPTPENPKVEKTSLSAEFAVSWSHHHNGPEHLASVLATYRVLALEGGSGAVSLFDIPVGMDDRPILLLLGSEFAGIDPALLRLAETSVYIPMLGFKRSLNVASAFSIAAYTLSFALLQQHKSVQG
jgi:tRNA G18 (ribose-2'-O)-methylase SpoU